MLVPAGVTEGLLTRCLLGAWPAPLPRCPRRMVKTIEQKHGPPHADEWRALTGKVFADCASGLASCHQRAALHMDVKPDNIFLFVDPDGGLVAKVRRGAGGRGGRGGIALSSAEAGRGKGIVVCKDPVCK